MTFDEAVALVQERALQLSKNEIFQKSLLEKGITDPKDALDLAHNIAIATLFGVVKGTVQ